MFTFQVLAPGYGEGPTPLQAGEEGGTPYTDVNVRNSYGLTPLHLAVLHQRRQAVVFLMRAGADPELRNGTGRSAFDIAKKDSGMYALMQALFEEQSHVLRVGYDREEDNSEAGLSEATKNWLNRTRKRGDPLLT